MTYSELVWRENTDCNEYFHYNGKVVTVFQLENLYGYYIDEPTSGIDLRFGFSSKEEVCQFAMKELS